MKTDKRAAREELMGLLGDLPEKDGEVIAETVDVREEEGYRVEKLLLELNGLEPVPALFVKPLNAKSPLPAILYNHAHGNDYKLGKSELISGRAELRSPYAKALTELGYAALCIDAWGFGERHTQTESAIFKHMLWSGRILWGMMVYDSLRAIDYLCARTDVDANRIGTLGMSMGSTMAWWVAALDTRIEVCVDICCMTDYRALIETNGLDLHGVYYYVPRLLKHFTAAQINALIAPRPHLSLNGARDPLTPLDGLNRIDEELRAAYRTENAENAWKLLKFDSAHIETAAMRKEAVSFIKNWL